VLLELEWKERRIADQSTLGTQTARRFLDYVFDGQSFYEAFGGDFVSPLGWLPEEQDDLHARRLLMEAEPDLEDRVAVLVCPEDAELYCGAVTARIERQGHEIRWRELAFSDPDWNNDAWVHDTASFASWPDLRFDADQYRSVITGRPRPDK
jgi:hypothetical protein